jgi:hypothetical protein
MTQSPLAHIPLEVSILNSIAYADAKVKIVGLWADIRTNRAISPAIVAMVDALIATNEDFYLFADIALGSEHYYVCQIV